MALSAAKGGVKDAKLLNHRDFDAYLHVLTSSKGTFNIASDLRVRNTLQRLFYAEIYAHVTSTHLRCELFCQDIRIPSRFFHLVPSRHCNTASRLNSNEASAVTFEM